MILTRSTALSLNVDDPQSDCSIIRKDREAVQITYPAAPVMMAFLPSSLPLPTLPIMIVFLTEMRVEGFGSRKR